MAIYTIGDLHLSFHENKPMNIFGDNWDNHEEKIKNNWIENVKENDLVVIPGDFSWSTYLKNTYEDFKYLNSLPGKKLLLKGNHDYWWTTLTSMRNFLKENEFETIDFIYNTAYEYENTIIAGTRGWSQTEESEDKKLLNREALRLELSLQEAMKLKNETESKLNSDKESENAKEVKKVKEGFDNENTEKEIIVFMHYPPITKSNLANNEENEFIQIMKKYNVKRCYYGHLHGIAIKEAVEGEFLGINFKLVSADGLDFKLLKI